MTLEDWTDISSRNFSNWLSTLRYIREERRSHVKLPFCELMQTTFVTLTQAPHPPVHLEVPQNPEIIFPVFYLVLTTLRTWEYHISCNWNKVLFEWVGKLVWWLLCWTVGPEWQECLRLQQLCRQQHDAAEMLAVASAFGANPSIFPFRVDTGQTASHPLWQLSVFFFFGYCKM